MTEADSEADAEPLEAEGCPGLCDDVGAGSVMAEAGSAEPIVRAAGAAKDIDVPPMGRGGNPGLGMCCVTDGADTPAALNWKWSPTIALPALSTNGFHCRARALTNQFVTCVTEICAMAARDAFSTLFGYGFSQC